MTVSLKHTFQSAKSDSADTTIVQPSNWNEEHELTLATNKVLGRATAGTGAAEELSIGTALSISGGTLAVTTVPAANGGTGLNSPGTSGNVLTSNGTGWTSAAPASTPVTYPQNIQSANKYSTLRPTLTSAPLPFRQMPALRSPSAQWCCLRWKTLVLKLMWQSLAIHW